MRWFSSLFLVTLNSHTILSKYKARSAPCISGNGSENQGTATQIQADKLAFFEGYRAGAASDRK
jgi:hypothetical protein